MKTLKMAVAAAVGLVLIASALAAPGTPNSGTAPAPPPPPPPTTITVFDQPNFKGRSLTFERRVASLAAVQFNDAIASVKIKGRDWVLCEHRNFFGKCVRIREKEKNLKRLKFDGRVSSLYPVPVTPPAPVKPR